jgi:hypothetical protein
MPPDHAADLPLQILWNWFNIEYPIDKIEIISRFSSGSNAAGNLPGDGY